MKRYRIADLLVDLEAFGRTEQQAEPYRVEADGPADITIERDAVRALELNPDLETLESALYMETGFVFSRELLKYNGTYLHSSSIILDGKAYLFSADSGTGKSTHTEKWIRLFGARCLNDDKPALRLVNGVWMAYGTPWSGKHDLSSPEGAPVGAIVFLKRGEKNSVRRITAHEAIPLMMAQSLRTLGPGQMERQLELMDHLIRTVPCWELTCRNDDEAAFVARAALTGR